MPKLKPLGPIPRELIDYHGVRARKGSKLEYTVTGRGNFPTDMLRYDDATALLSPHEIEGRGERTVLIINAGGCTPARWSSFGWSVHDNVREVAA